VVASGLVSDPVTFTLRRRQAVIVRDGLTTIHAVISRSRRARRVVTANLVIAAIFITGLVVWDLVGHLPLPLGVAGHEGSTVIVGLNGLRLAACRPRASGGVSSDLLEVAVVAIGPRRAVDRHGAARGFRDRCRGGAVTEDGIFLKIDGELVVLRRRTYDSEDVLQTALEEFPDVIAGSTTSGQSTGRLLLVRRELGIPSTSGGSNVWSIDHLFLDSEGVPVFVEVKRSTDTRIRREVVGQMLDYAANGVVHWPVAVLRTALQETAQGSGYGPEGGDDLVTAVLGRDDVEEFWAAVETNLVRGRIRMVFVADQLPRELVRVIEFLNEQMNPAEVLGVELRQYIGANGHVAYVPGVVGRTGTALATKDAGGSPGQLWHEETFLAAAAARRPADQVAFVQQLLGDVHDHGHHLGWGKGATPGVSGWYSADDQPMAVWNLNINGEQPGARAYLYFYLSDLAKRLPLERIEQAARTLERIPAMKPKIEEARAQAWGKYPSIYLNDVLSSDTASAVIFEAIRCLTASA
jgi:hypothetical protein